MCGKLRFASSAEAKRFARQKGFRGESSRKPPTNAYQCSHPECAGAWHLTSIGKVEQRRRGYRRKDS